MKKTINFLKNKILNGESIDFQEAKSLIFINNSDKDLIFALLDAANEIREKFCGNNFNLCTIMNAKSGRCSEDCSYCAQSTFFKTSAPIYPLVTKESALELALSVEQEGAHRFSLVTSGKGIFSPKEIEPLVTIYNFLNNKTDIHLCASHGILNYEAALALKNSGVSTYHHNLETSENFYKNICSTHTYEDRVNTILSAQKAGLEVCSGGILGLGETELDRLDLAFTLKKLNIKSVPLNFLTPIVGTPLENATPLDPFEILKTIAVFRFILPDSTIRYAGGRDNLKSFVDLGLKGGINAALTGNFLTTTGSTIASDIKLAIQEGFKIEK